MARRALLPRWLLVPVAAALAMVLGCGGPSGGDASAAQPSVSPAAVPSDIAVAAQPFGAALGSAQEAMGSAQAEERADAGNLARLRADVAGELAAVRGLEQSLQRVPFPPDLRSDEVAHLASALQQAEAWLQAAAGAATVEAARAALAEARQAQARAALSETLIARFLGVSPPPSPAP